MKIYKYRKRSAGLFLISGTLLIIGSFFFCFTATFFKDYTSDLQTFIKVIIILISGAGFFIGLALFANGLNEDKAGTKIAFADTGDGRLYMVAAMLENPEFGGLTAVGKLKKAYENTQIAERNDEKLDLMEDKELPLYVEALINGDDVSDYPQFPGKIITAELENPQIVKTSRFGVIVWYTNGRSRQIFSVDISRRYQGFHRIIEIIEAAPCRVNYRGKRVGDCFGR